MTDTQKLFILLMEIFPENSIMSLDTSDEDLLEIIAKMENSKIEHNYTAEFPLTKENKNALLKSVRNGHSEERIHRLRICHNHERLFVAYDGCEIGIMSKKVNVTPEFNKECINSGLCGLVDEVPEA
jgi:hypothetical protein